MTEDEGGLLAIPRIEDGNLIVAIYPLSEGDYVIQPSLNRGPWEGYTPDNDAITVTAEDGTVMEGIAEGYSPFAGYEFYEWNFGPAEPGKYTLNVPFVYQLLNEQLIAQENNAQRVWVDNDGGRLDAQFNIHDALIRLTDYRVSEYSDKSPDIDEITKIMNELYAEIVWWDVDYEIENKNPDRELIWFIMRAESPDGVNSVEKKTKDGFPVNINRYNFDMVLEPAVNPETGMEYSKPAYCRIYIYGGENYVDFSVNNQALAYKWNHPFTIEFEVK